MVGVWQHNGGGSMALFIRTSSDAHLQRHRDTHAKHPEFGTHRHPYLHDLMREVATSVTMVGGELPSLLDYGCGKGAFMAEMARLNLFRYIRGYDPAIPVLNVRPAQVYDVVSCLDVLDQLEEAFVEPTIKDVAQFTGRIAVFNVITRQVPQLEHLNPRSGQIWQEIIGRHMRVSRMTIRPSTLEEIAQGACPERVIITADPCRAAG
jgi:hypothetical protein